MKNRIILTDGVELLETKPGKFIPYSILETLDGGTVRSPLRGFNKKGNRVWRTYKSVEEARENLRLG